MTEKEYKELVRHMENHRAYMLEREEYRAKSKKHIGFANATYMICHIEELMAKHIPEDLLNEATEGL